MYQKTHWSFLPESIRAQARDRYGSRQLALDIGAECQRAREPGPGDGYLYHWISETPSDRYRGPMPFGQLIRRTLEV